MHTAFQLPDIPGEALGQHVHHRIGQQRVVLAGLLLKDTAARAGVGLFNTGKEPRTETRHKAVVHVPQLAGAKELVRTTRLPFSCRDLMVESTSSCIFSLPWRKCTSSRSSKSTSRKRPLKRSTVLDWRACTKQLENSSAVRYSTLGLERLLASHRACPTACVRCVLPSPGPELRNKVSTVRRSAPCCVQQHTPCHWWGRPQSCRTHTASGAGRTGSRAW